MTVGSETDAGTGEHTADVVVLGGGPAGYACALRATDHGLTAAVIEADRIGGTCLHRGCVPTRAMLHAAAIADTVGKPAERWGVKTTLAGIDMARLVGARDDVVTRNHRAVARHLEHAEVEIIAGRGVLAGPRHVVVDGRDVRARRAIVLATGSAPRTLPQLLPDGRRVLTSDQVLELSAVPASVLALGGGAVGVEFAQVWRALGADVTLAEIQPGLVPTEDADVGKELSRALRRRGITVQTGVAITDATVTADGVTLTFDRGGETVQETAEVVLLAVGREPASAGLGLEDVGIRLDGGFVVPANWETLETHVPGVYAVGDLLPSPSIGRAHVAFAEGMLVADAIAGQRTFGIDYVNVPRITHGLTETASVGMSEDEARASGADIDVRAMPLGFVAKGLMFGEPGLAKVITRRGGPVLGVHLVGPHVNEFIGEAMLITGFEATPGDVAPLAHPHPTLSEALGEVHQALAGRPLHLR